MTKIKLCGLMQKEDIRVANECRPDYIGFIFYPKSRRYVTPELAREWKRELDPGIQTVGVFVREEPGVVAGLLESGVIDVAQLHGGESEDYIRELRTLTAKPLIQAFRIDTAEDVQRANLSSADYILLDSGTGGTGTTFDWELVKEMERAYFLAGGLGTENVSDAVRSLQPFAVDVSSGIETDGRKDPEKMRRFVTQVREIQAQNDSKFK